MAVAWGNAWFDHVDAEVWLDAHDNRIAPELTARLRDAGLTPTDSALRLWYGKIKPDAALTRSTSHAGRPNAD